MLTRPLLAVGSTNFGARPAIFPLKIMELFSPGYDGVQYCGTDTAAKVSSDIKNG
jgi:hypothetical protein